MHGSSGVVLVHVYFALVLSTCNFFSFLQTFIKDVLIWDTDFKIIRMRKLTSNVKFLWNVNLN